MRTRARQVRLNFAVVAALIASSLAWFTPVAHATTTTYSQTLTTGNLSSSSAEALAWDTFRAALTGTYDKIVMTSSNSNFSLSLVSSSIVPQIATNLRSGTAGNWTISGKQISIGSCVGIEFSVHTTNTNCGCPSDAGIFTLRPTINNNNWGGAGGATCGAATQTITLTFTIDAPSASTFSTTQTSPTNISAGGVITFSLILTQSVSDFTSADLQFGGTSACNTPTISGSGTTYSITVTNCSAGILTLQLKANSVTGTQAGPSEVNSSNTIIIDRTAPTITSISAPANSTYVSGNSITFTANMSETVTVTGTPRLAIVVGATTRYATYASGSNSRSLLFTYVVQTTLSDIDTDGIVLNSPLSLNGGTILDLATNALSVLTFTPPTMSSVLVAQKPGAPTIDSISATSGQLAIYFTPGASNGSTITNYEYSTNNGTNWTTRSPTATTSPITISGLVNGTSYPVRIRAINAAGSGDSSTAVSATPTAVLVAGGSDISITYGQSASSSQFTATGGTGIYTFTLSSTPAGVSINNAIVSVDSTTAAGTYTLNVIATDNAGSPQSGFKQIVITIAKATSSISIALPSSATSAALNGAVIITATVSKPGSVNFKLGGTTISGCGAASASTTTATCSWTPGALGSVSLTAIFTPTDASNYETSTTATLSITVVNGVSTITLSLTGGTTTPPKGQTINIIATIDQAGKVTFLADGKRIPGCINLSASAGTKICAWKPSIQKLVNITATLNPTSNVYNNSTSRLAVQVVRRVGTR